MSIRLGFLLLVLMINGCLVVKPKNLPLKTTIRPAKLQEYYSVDRRWLDHTTQEVRPTRNYILRRIVVHSLNGDIILDYYQQPKLNEAVVMVFPVLGGKAIIESYLADYIAKQGIDTVIVHRNDEFKDPRQFEQLEEVFHRNIIKDRIAIDFISKEFKKKDFGGVGMSRGAINLATLAGIDQRLKANVFILGASDLGSIFCDSNQRRVEHYVESVTRSRGIDEKDFKQLFNSNIKTEPNLLADYIEPSQSLMFLAIFDKTVPYKYGLKLKEQIGHPETVYLFANHFTTLVFTQIVKIFGLGNDLGIFPPDFIESKTVKFLKEKLELR